MFGLWTVLKVLPVYSSYLHFGSRTAMRFRIPSLEADNDSQSINQLKAAVFYGSLYPMLVLCAVLVGLAFLLDVNFETRVGLVGTSLILVLTWRFDFLMSLLKAHQKFRVISATNYFKATVYLILTVGLVVLFGFYGVLLTGIATLAVTTRYLLRLEKIRAPAPQDFKAKIYIDLVKSGLPIVVFDVTVLFIRTSDRFILLYFFDVTEVGFYGVAAMIMGFALSIPGVAREVVEPRLMQSFERLSLEDSVHFYLTRPLFNTAYLMPFVIGAGVLIFPTVVAWLLPDYIECVDVVIILLLSSFYTAAVYTLRGIIVACQLQSKASFILVGALLFNFVLSICLIRMDFGMEGVAIATGLTFCLLLIGLLVLIHLHLSNLEVGLPHHLMFTIMPFLVMCCLLLISTELFTPTSEGIVFTLIFRTLFFLLGQGALLMFMWKKGFVLWKAADQ